MLDSNQHRFACKANGSPLTPTGHCLTEYVYGLEPIHLSVYPRYLLHVFKMADEEGIEPSNSVSKTDIHTIGYLTYCLVLRGGIEPPISPYQEPVIPFN